MTDTPLPPAHRIGPGSVSVRRTGTRTYEGSNARGVTVQIGPADAAGHFTPGELFKLALAGCAGMSTDRVISRRLGEDYETVIWAHGTSEPDDRYDAVDEEMLLALGALEPADREKLLRLIRRSIDASCTIARTVHDSVDLATTVNDEPV
ncbi:OsmC family protein [Cryobacterium tepidiphilum]|uniref:OsmC family peroxiredoxin n=1 Tax=Cryobacterium tepidiphilum TaxID=2486026 RepID=A0A3M8L110_9MICO|nr:OsmC family protein [Cryobacterium tepidiphilum]RNE59230.1 hypothetical protein EEJ31_10710 [Cryobacterium tepidiphilum]